MFNYLTPSTTQNFTSREGCFSHRLSPQQAHTVLYQVYFCLYRWAVCFSIGFAFRVGFTGPLTISIFGSAMVPNFFCSGVLMATPHLLCAFTRCSHDAAYQHCMQPISLLLSLLIWRQALLTVGSLGWWTCFIFCLDPDSLCSIYTLNSVLSVEMLRQ
jgi:hypothetical protein